MNVVGVFPLRCIAPNINTAPYFFQQKVLIFLFISPCENINECDIVTH